MKFLLFIGFVLCGCATSPEPKKPSTPTMHCVYAQAPNGKKGALCVPDMYECAELRESLVYDGFAHVSDCMKVTFPR